MNPHLKHKLKQHLTRLREWVENLKKKGPSSQLKSKEDKDIWNLANLSKSDRDNNKVSLFHFLINIYQLHMSAGLYRWYIPTTFLATNMPTTS